MGVGVRDDTIVMMWQLRMKLILLIGQGYCKVGILLALTEG